MQQWLEALILGLVEGLTEFLPVSSTGHLIIGGQLIGFDSDMAPTFEVCIQLGAILAVVFLYWPRFLALFNFKQGRGFSGLRAWGLLAVTSFPASLMGLLTHDYIETNLFNPVTVAWALLVGGIILLFIERVIGRVKPEPTTGLDNLTFKDAAIVGVFQCFSLWPGMSRSASTIIGGMVSGLDRKTAAEFSFIAAVPIMVLATAYVFAKHLGDMSSADMQVLGLGFVVSLVSAVLAVKAFVGFLQRHALWWFGVYRIVVAVLCFWLFL
ncbi:MAG: undecaprenyl-diphosphate phosphatase [Cyanobacteria bacterium HKST-UBA06]|nr:undecaprenyl-diphosphate phosphatase [Cyanobacteria bacterium HKST-UBA06]